MPCYDPYYNDRIEVRTEFRNGVDPGPYEHVINKLKDKVKYLEAGLCALITELEKRGISNEVISQASKSGLIDLMGFWSDHSKSDEARLSKELHKFSEHEQEMLRKILNNK